MIYSNTAMLHIGTMIVYLWYDSYMEDIHVFSQVLWLSLNCFSVLKCYQMIHMALVCVYSYAFVTVFQGNYDLIILTLNHMSYNCIVLWYDCHGMAMAYDVIHENVPVLLYMTWYELLCCTTLIQWFMYFCDKVWLI